MSLNVVTRDNNVKVSYRWNPFRSFKVVAFAYTYLKSDQQIKKLQRKQEWILRERSSLSRNQRKELFVSFPFRFVVGRFIYLLLRSVREDLVSFVFLRSG